MTYDPKPSKQFVSQLSKLSVINNKLPVNLGFTLIELLAVFILMSIVSGIGFASFASYSRRQAVRESAANLGRTIDLASFNALSLVKPQVCASNEILSNFKVNICSNTLCGISGVDYEIKVTCGGIEKSLNGFKLPQNIMFSNVSGSPTCATLKFGVLTEGTTGTPCEIHVEGFGNQIKVSIDSNGRVTY